jgi:hypothetical protein
MLPTLTYGVQVVVVAAQADDMGSDSEVSDGDDATNEQLQQQYLHSGGMMDFGGGAAPSSAGLLPFEPAPLLY